MIITIIGFGTAVPGFFKPNSLVESTRQLGEFSIVVTGLTVVMLAGGIDLSVSSIFALAAFAAVSGLFILDLPVWACLLLSLGVGALFGAVNGYLIGFMRLRAFLTTLVTLVIGRAVYDILIVNFAAAVQQSDITSTSGTSSAMARYLAFRSASSPRRSSPSWHTWPSPDRAPAGTSSRSADRDVRPTMRASACARPSSCPT